MLHVIATVELNAGTRDAYLAELKAVTPAVRAEDGCIQYEAAAPIVTDISTNKTIDPNVVVILEKWRDLAALKAHLGAPHMAVYREKVKGMRSGLTIQVLEPSRRRFIRAAHVAVDKASDKLAKGARSQSIVKLKHRHLIDRSMLLDFDHRAN